MRPKEVEPTVTEIITNSEYWNKRRLNYLGDNIYFDQEIRTGVCSLCKRNGRIQKSNKTFLHHLKYDHEDKLAWTIEVCGGCHWQIDPKNREAIAKRTGKEIQRRYGKYDRPYYENKEQVKKREEQEKKDWWMRYCANGIGGWEPIPRFIPNQEFYDKVVEAIKANSPSGRWKKSIVKKEPLSDVSRRYF